MVKNAVKMLLAVLALSAAGCSYAVKSPSMDLPAGSKVAVGSVVNNSETAMAADKVRALLAARVKLSFGEDSPVYQPSYSDDVIPRQDAEAARSWAVSQGANYVLSATVEEWRYKSGLDGEPAVGLTLELKETATGRSVWSASGAKTGWGRSSLAATGGKLLDKLLSGLEAAAK